MSCEEMAESKANIQFHMRGENLDKKDFFGKVILLIQSSLDQYANQVYF